MEKSGVVIRNQNKIKEATVKVLSDDLNATITEIAEEANVSRAVIHKHFSTKENLVRMVILDYLDEYYDELLKIKAKQKPEKQLKSIVIKSIDYGSKYHQLLYSENIYSDVQILDAFTRIYNLTEKIFENLKELGFMRTDMNARYMYLIVENIVFGSILGTKLKIIKASEIQDCVLKVLNSGIE